MHQSVKIDTIARFKCPLCEHTSEVASNLNIHMHNHIGTTYLCNLCDFMSKHIIGFRSHFMTTHDKEPRGSMRKNTTYQCAICEIQAGAKDYYKHMIKIHQLPRSETMKQLKRHNINQHTKKHKSAVIKYKCPLCEYRSELNSNVSHHINNHIKTSYSCNFCQFLSNNRNKFRDHFLTMHEVESKERGLMRKHTTYHCPICNIQAAVQEYKIHLIKFHKLPAGNNKYP